MQCSEKVSYYLDSMVKAEKTPGLQYIVVNQDDVLFSYTKGYSDIAGKATVNEKTKFNAYSVTKTFTAIAILQLVEQKKMNLDNFVTRYYPENPYNGITIRQLLSHTAGLPNPIPLNWIHLATEDSDFNSKQFVDEIIRKNNKLKNKSGEKFSYSNIGFLVLGIIIENVSGMSYREYVRQNILDKIPLERNEMDFVIYPKEDHAKGYQKTNTFLNLLLGLFIDKKKYMIGKEDKWSAFKPLYVNGSSYGGLIGNARAFSKYLQDLLRHDSKLLSVETKKQMFLKQKLNDGKEIAMSLGWFHGILNGKKYYTHPGGGGGYYTEIRIYPSHKMATVIMMNRSGMSDERLLDKVDILFIN